jgi:predicted nucleotidyltransferase
MRTTMALDEATRDRLMQLKEKWDVATLEMVVQRLLEGPARSAKSLFTENERAVRQVLRKYGIRGLVAFGSRARGEGRPDSDLDLAGAFPRSADLFDLVHLKDDLTVAFGVPVDFVSLNAATGSLRKEIERGVELVA